ncbi:MAG: EAL domain-containing protein [Lachnospiraceae bacterium]|nr:EAL domain-containing protein [Lachnospiraceae bacterium]
MNTTDIDPESLKNVERFIRKFSKATGIYIGCFGSTCFKLIDYSDDANVNACIRKYITQYTVGELYARVAIDGIEEQVVDNTEEDDIKVAACSIRVGGRCRMFFVLGFVDIRADEKANPDFKILTYRSTFDKFLNAIDIVRTTITDMLDARMSIYRTEEISRQTADNAKELSESLRRMSAMTEVLKFLDTDKKPEIIMGDYLAVTAGYLGTTYGAIVKLTDTENRTMDVIAQWSKEGYEPLYANTHNVAVPDFVEGIKPIILSHGSRFLPETEKGWEDVRIMAIVALPVPLIDRSNMYIIYVESEAERSWKLDELQFLSDSSRVLQNILEKRIHKNSLASSYASLEEILEHVGCAIIVLDNNSHEILFQNQIMKTLFPPESINPDLEKMIATAYDEDKELEFYDYSTGLYYDINHNIIRWVDARRVSLFAIYDVTDKKNYQKRIEQQAYTDFLTGLFNRLCCERDLARIIDEAKKSNKKGALLYLDLDDFKHINDGLGHQYGDVLLKDISRGMRDVRGLEENCYRMGGDEFVIIIPPRLFDDYERIIEEIKKVFATPFYLKDSEYYCTMSMGIVVFPDEGDKVEELVQKADVAMYEAKKSGKNRMSKYVTGSTNNANKRLDMEKNMRDASSGDFEEFLVYYQPIIDIQEEGNPCVGAEALLRWDSKELGFVKPSDFIPLAEYLGLINPIGDHVLKEACKTLYYWNTHGHPDYKVNVNLSVVQLMQNDIVDTIEKTVRESHINPKNLTLEVTESLAINDMDRMQGIMSAIRSMGIRIALDDFGTGYSSLNHIREIPLDVIKVDQSFVKELIEDDYSKSFIRMVAELAGAIGVSICVEGVETEEQYRILENMQVRLVQGYHFDRPMSKQDFVDKYC